MTPFLPFFLQSILKERSKILSSGQTVQVGRVHMQGILLTRHCQVEVISIIKENPQEEEQVIVELDIQCVQIKAPVFKPQL